MSTPIYSKEIFAVFDVMYDLTCGPHTEDTIREKMRLIRQMGIRKIYLVAQQDTSSAWQKDHPSIYPPESKHYVMPSVLNLGDPWFQYVRLAKEEGLEVIIRYKLYESGGAFSLPDDVKPLLPYNLLPEVGGNGYGYPDFIYRHPQFRVKRLNHHPESRPITAAEFVFLAEPVDVRSIRNGEKIHLDCSPESFEGLDFRYSIHNGPYTHLDVTPRIFTEPRIITRIDGSGEPLFPKPVLCQVLRFENLSLPENAGYVALRYDNPEKHFTLPFTMMKLYSGTEEITCTATHIPRHKPMLLDNMTFIGDGPLDFTRNGFEFDSIESIFWGDGVFNYDLGIGLARGKMEYMKGALCEAYPEVRDYWLRRIKTFIDMGADGISIRFRCHSCSNLDFAQFGGNAPLLERYRQLHGETDKIDPAKMMAVRGSFFLEFYEQARQLLHANGKTLECDAQADFCNPHFDIDYNHVGFWPMPKILPDWKRLIELSDTVTLNDYNHTRYTPEQGAPMKEYAASLGKKMQLHCYLQQGDDFNEEFLKGVQADPRITGIELYEMVDPPAHGRGVFRVDEDSAVHVNPSIIERLKKYTSTL